MEKEVSYWLKEGKQSKITSAVKKIVKNFNGENMEKIYQILEWIEKNIPHHKDQKKVTEIFANRSVDKIIKDKFNIGCHDTAVLTATFLRALGIPAKFIEGINKLNKDNAGHCIVEAYINSKWILIDPSYFIISLKPKRNLFYKENYITGEGLDSWDNGIKTFADWKRKSQKTINYIKKLNK